MHTYCQKQPKQAMLYSTLSKYTSEIYLLPKTNAIVAADIKPHEKSHVCKHLVCDSQLELIYSKSNLEKKYLKKIKLSCLWLIN